MLAPLASVAVPPTTIDGYSCGVLPYSVAMILGPT
jgi:hypothetical protein